MKWCLKTSILCSMLQLEKAGSLMCRKPFAENMGKLP